jgi:hypothetical protein
VLHIQGKHPDARFSCERALTIRQTELGLQHADVVESLNLLAELLHALGEFLAALPLRQRVLAIHERELGPQHPQVVVDLAKVAALLPQCSNVAAAWPLYERILAIDEALYGPTHANIAADLRTFALVAGAHGDVPRAREYAERAERIEQFNQESGSGSDCTSGSDDESEVRAQTCACVKLPVSFCSLMFQLHLEHCRAIAMCNPSQASATKAKTAVTRYVYAWLLYTYNSFVSFSNARTFTQDMESAVGSVMLQCSKFHRLAAHRTVSKQYSCALCRERIVQGAKIASCLLCGYDVCEQCMMK